MKILLVISFLISTYSFGQRHMKITLNNGKVVEGNYKIKMTTMQMPTKFRIVSRKTKEKYTIDKIDKLYMFTENDSILFEAIDTRRNFDRGPIKKKLGQVIFKGNNISLFAVETLPAGGGQTYIKSTYNEFFAKKTEQTLAYNIGYIQGAGPTGIKTRIKNYFADCPLILEKINAKEIPKKDAAQIALYYENNCGK